MLCSEKSTSLVQLMHSVDPELGVDCRSLKQTRFYLLHDSPNLSVDTLFPFLEAAFVNLGSPSILELDCADVDLIVVSSARVLVQAIALLTQRHEVVPVLRNCREHFWQQIEAISIQYHVPLWAECIERQGALVLGHLPTHLRQLLPYLATPATPSELSIQTTIPIQRLSIYLNSLHSLGILLRERILGTQRDSPRRGWTYKYQLPLNLAIHVEK